MNLKICKCSLFLVNKIPIFWFPLIFLYKILKTLEAFIILADALLISGLILTAGEGNHLRGQMTTELPDVVHFGELNKIQFLHNSAAGCHFR
jgi:hypothetical protein